MKLSPVWEAELSLLPAGTVIDDRGALVVVRSEEFPDHIWKNFILVDRLPQGECKDLLNMYRAEFPKREFSIAFGWNHPPPSRRCVADFRRHGFTVTRDLVLSANPEDITNAPKGPVTLRECRSSADWNVVIQRRIQFLCDEPFKEFKTQFESDKFQIYRELADGGRGHWFIASASEQDVADVGIFYSHDNRASIEELLVYPAVRRRGLGVATVLAACQTAMETRIPEGFITVAGEDRLARRLRADFGFSKGGFIERGHWHNLMKRETPWGEQAPKVR